MSNAKAIDELLRLFGCGRKTRRRQVRPRAGKFKAAFQQLTAIRRWGPEDRIRRPAFASAGKKRSMSSGSPSARSRSRSSCGTDATRHSAPQQRCTSSRSSLASGGSILDRSQIGEIGYHATAGGTADPAGPLPSSKDGAASIRLLTTDEVMFVSPFTPMSVAPTTLDPVAEVRLPPGDVSRVCRVSRYWTACRSRTTMH